ncbi:hypothetical protein ODI_R0477 [Orrella dioscoreae]|uniref:Uncharacterized protein n=1 Tax=Orrella dioscoreae TaxID=1851544 RepID=A0A1C3K4U4_9BURK|nr:hypothetical protein ODI_04275 [Orrella dioscoreae]SOE46808.1 hypothetical protein ODI_R0477 [Orrella dioscoreae]
MGFSMMWRDAPCAGWRQGTGKWTVARPFSSPSAYRCALAFHFFKV